VTYAVYLTIDAQELPIRAGMTANAELITANLQDVLLVPNRAIIADRQSGKYYVDLLRNGETVRTEVRIGSRDSDYTQIIQGLEDGDQLTIGQERALDLLDGPPGG
jgi:hypothetical protein